MTKVKNLTKAERQQVHDRFGGKCSYCGDPLVKGWHVDHLKAIKRTSYWNKKLKRFVNTGNCNRPEHDTMDNLMPSCASCNINKRDLSLEGFRKFITNLIVSLNRDSVQYKIAKRYGLVKETSIKVKFWFETYQNHIICDNIEDNTKIDPENLKKWVEANVGQPTTPPVFPKDRIERYG